MAETIAALIGAVVGASITASFWFVQHRIEQKDYINHICLFDYLFISS